jgi:hypothetical protein
VLVDDAGEEGDRGRAAAGDEAPDVVGARVGDQVQGGDDHEPGAGQVALGMGEVDVDAGLEQRAVELAEQRGPRPGG